MVPVLLTTARLRLRVPSLADAQAIFAGYATDPEVTRYLAWRPHPSLATTLAFLQRTIVAIETRAECATRGWNSRRCPSPRKSVG